MCRVEEKVFMPEGNQSSTKLIAEKLRPTEFDVGTVEYIRVRLQESQLCSGSKGKKAKQNFIDAIKILDSTTIIILSLHYPFFVALCQLPSLRKHWEAKIKEQGIGDNPNYCMLSQANIAPFNLVRAADHAKLYIQYEHYKEQPDSALLQTEDEAKESLRLAASLGSFYASCILLRDMLFDLKRIRCNKSKDIEVVSVYADSVVELHGTPGCLLASYAYFILGRNFDNMRRVETEEKPKKDLQQRANICYCIALRHFYMAVFLKPYSSAAINNAFFGLELLDTFGKFFGEMAPDNFFSGGERRTQEILFIHCANSTNQQAAYTIAAEKVDEIKEDLIARGISL
jgi:hypothetical protein